MNILSITKLLGTAVVALTLSTAANALLLTPDTADFDGNAASGPYGPENCEPGCINDLFGTDFSNSDLLFKADEPSTESGSFANSYNFSWNNDLSGGSLTWDLNQPYIFCEGCYVAVKDGDIDPRYYFFDISSWDGMETITLAGFWADNPVKGDRGEISHFSIFGTTGVPVPEPSTLALLGLGLAGLGFARRKTAKK